MEEELKLFGKWSSPFSCRVKCALKLKGLKYEYVEEDLENKSDLLLKYNPVHKKIPVLVHGGKPIVESMVIVEYIDEMWPENYLLLPKDPYQKSVARFWTKFVEDKSSSLWACFLTAGEQQEKALKETLDILKTIEEHGGLGDKKFFGGDTIGLMDLAFGILAYWLGVIEDVIEVKMVEAHTFPSLHAFIKRFEDVPCIKENLPNRDDLVIFFKHRREMRLAASIPSH